MRTDQLVERLYRIVYLADVIEMTAYDLTPDWREKALRGARAIAESIKAEAEQTIEAVRSKGVRTQPGNNSMSSNV